MQTLIDISIFIKLYMERSMKMGSSVEAIHRLGHEEFYSLQLDLSRNPIRDPQELLPLFGYTYEFSDNGDCEIHLVGSCNCLLCFIDSDQLIILWNLATCKYFELPCFKFTDFTYYVNYGSGYDGASNDYKVIRLINSNGKSDCFIVDFYSLKSKSWIRLEDLVSSIHLDNYGILVGGALHRLTNETKWDDECPIVAFDLTKEEFILVPCVHLPSRITWMNLGTFQGCLCLFCHYHVAGVELWVMEDYGIKESWTKVYINNSPYIPCMRVIDRSKRKSIMILEVIKKFRRLLWCNNMEENSIKTIKNSCLRSFLEACVYYESLVGTCWNRYDGIVRRSSNRGLRTTNRVEILLFLLLFLAFSFKFFYPNVV
ncbi:F-box protein CPR30 [Abeliophyllum distichum]|uniref:F-box protein CPR30 n=1 Tax=Abeliophyllum distichum TaxID=126358 RepID=A0ABD1PQS0_9LAMI